MFASSTFAIIGKDLLKMVEKKRIIERGAELYNFNAKRAPPNEVRFLQVCMNFYCSACIAFLTNCDSDTNM